MAHTVRVLLAWILAILPGLAGSNSPTLQLSNSQTVLPGIDVLLSDSSALIAGQRLGLITNQTGIDAHGVSTIDRLSDLAGWSHSPLPTPRLVALFAPEHGIRGAARPGEIVSDTTDGATGLPIYSLYGTNRAPTADQLNSLDILVVDLQDVGARPFTYVSTMVLAMRAAAAAGKRIVVLDRPNPIGCAMEGPVLDTAFASFIGMLPIPLRHGMTMGELARFANAELHIGADLVVVPVKGWRRCMWFDETGLPWVRPSPNLPDLASVAWYPGTVLFEATNLSVGRGTDAPFRQVGAPWMTRPSAGRWQLVTFTPRSPGDGKFADALSQGVRLNPFDRRRHHPIATAIALLAAIETANPDSFRVDPRGMAIRLGKPWHRGFSADQRELSAFKRRVRPYLIYP
jgi:uncharacterized protein YbbC (DUF1343 family)